MNKSILLSIMLSVGISIVASNGATSPSLISKVGGFVKCVAGDTVAFFKARATNVKNAAVWSKDTVVSSVKSSANFVSSKAIASKNWTVDTAKTHPYYFTAGVIAICAAVYVVAPKINNAYKNWKNSADEADDLSFENVVEEDADAEDEVA